MKKRVRTGDKRRGRRMTVKNPVRAVDEHLHPFPQLTPIGEVPGVGAVLERAKLPYRKNPLTEDEALNLVCDARKNEPALPIEKLFKKFKHDLGD
ncbi:MAG TPA: hypothetical protein VKU44_01065 [Terriglobia bacterium]|nr:hypothetical protein [Terriglobia bacterium]